MKRTVQRDTDHSKSEERKETYPIDYVKATYEFRDSCGRSKFNSYNGCATLYVVFEHSLLQLAVANRQ